MRLALRVPYLSSCPTGAIVEKSNIAQVLDELESKRHITIAQFAPSVRVTISEELGMAPGQMSANALAKSLKDLGFDYVFDTNFSADLTILEEGSELLKRLELGGPFPMFTSCCPAWVTMCEKSYPHLLKNLSTARSPQQMLGSIVKNIFSQSRQLEPKSIKMVSIMPCTAKKYEAHRPEFSSQEYGADVDYVLTTRELGKMLRMKQVKVSLNDPEMYLDSPMAESTGAGMLFGATGGVMEAALRSAQILSGVDSKDLIPLGGLSALRGLDGVKAAKAKLKKKNGESVQVSVAAVNGIGYAKHLLEKMQSGQVSFDFIEVMSCPGGCIGGGGQPKSRDIDILSKRIKSVYSLDERAVIRKSHENPSVQQLYQEHLGHPLSDLSHKLLHTHYVDRSNDF
jgi:NADH-quinone oxidoreductase subunit G